ncbi:MAG: major capsid protein [Microviridae sp.]|nr:MAG: major capsid protein [Microviridae sp.]
MSKLFNQVSMSKPKKSLIDLSHEKKLTMNMGDLVPIMVQECVPGDKFRVNTESLIRLAPMVAPAMHRVNAYIHYFFVPNRLLWDNWADFITGGADGKAKPTMPYVYVGNTDSALVHTGSLADYMGIPTADSVTQGNGLIALPFRAYQLIYNEYYRDQNLSQPVAITKNDGIINGSELLATMQIRKRAWEKDYFTSALPWSQRGDEIELPNNLEYKPVTDTTNIVDYAGAAVTGSMTAQNGQIQVGSGVASQIENIKSIGITINDLRRSARLQEFLEKTARGGSRLTEVVKAFFGVTSSDARLQRPEFIGGTKQPISISEVLATFNNTETAGATMYGHGISVGNTKYVKKFCEEHGWLIGIMSVLPRTSYQNSLPKQFLKFDKFDFYWPTFAQLGEQPVFDHEVFFDWTQNLDNMTTWGYQSRYAEYKYQPSTVHGDFRTSLSYWHLGRQFTTQPNLNESFVMSDPSQRIFADTDAEHHHLWVQLYNDVKAIRPMPYFNNPIL